MVRACKNLVVALAAVSILGCGNSIDRKGLTVFGYIKEHGITAERDSKVVRGLLDTPFASLEAEHRRVYAAFQLLGFNKERIGLAEFHERQRMLRMLGEPVVSVTTIGEALEYETTNAPSLRDLRQRWFQSRLRVRFAVTVDSDPDSVFSDPRYRYHGHSIWLYIRPNGSSIDNPNLGLTVQNDGSEPVEIRFSTLTLPSPDEGAELKFSCSEEPANRQIAPGTTALIFCEDAGNRPDYKGIRYAVERINDAARLAMERSSPLVLYSQHLGKDFFPDFDRDDRALEEAFALITKTNCLDRGVCQKIFAGAAQKVLFGLLSLIPLAAYFAVGLHFYRRSGWAARTAAWRLVFFLYLLSAIAVLSFTVFNRDNLLVLVSGTAALWLGAPWSFLALPFLWPGNAPWAIWGILFGGVLINAWLLRRIGWSYWRPWRWRRVEQASDKSEYSGTD